MKYFFFDLIVSSFSPHCVTLVGAGPDDNYTHPNLLRDTNEATTTTDASQDESNVESEVASRTSRST